MRTAKLGPIGPVGAFDVQLFESTPVDKAKILTGEKIDELSVVFKTGPDGKQWGPRNPEARILGLKAGATDGEGKKPNWFERAIETVRKGWMINDDVPDNIDGDGDGSEDYEQIIGLLMSAYWDTSSAMNIGDSGARSSALCTVVDNFLTNLDDVRGGGNGDVKKAGARHSKADADHINAIAAAAKDAADGAKKASNAADTIKTHSDALMAAPAKDAEDDGMGDDDAAAKATAIAQKAAADKAAADAAAAKPVPPENIALAIKAAMDGLATELLQKIEAQSAATQKALEAHTVAIDAKLETKFAEVATKAATSETEVSTLKASIAAMVGAARQPSAPGALITQEPDGTRKAAAMLGDSEAALPKILPTDPATGKNGAIRRLLVAQRG